VANRQGSIRSILEQPQAEQRVGKAGSLVFPAIHRDVRRIEGNPYPQINSMST
jgi:hypothetical protein